MKTYLKQQRLERLQNKLKKTPHKPLYVRPHLIINGFKIPAVFNFRRIYRDVTISEGTTLFPDAQKELLKRLSGPVSDFRIEIDAI